MESLFQSLWVILGVVLVAAILVLFGVIRALRSQKSGQNFLDRTMELRKQQIANQERIITLLETLVKQTKR